MAAPTISLTIYPEAIVKGAKATLSWVTSGAGHLTMPTGVASGTLPDGSATLYPTTTTTYTVVASGAGGTATDTATVTVHPPGTVLPTKFPWRFDTSQMDEQSELEEELDELEEKLEKSTEQPMSAQQIDRIVSRINHINYKLMSAWDRAYADLEDIERGKK